MKFSHLVTFRNQLNALSIHPARSESVMHTNQIQFVLQQAMLDELSTAQVKINQQIQAVQNIYNDIEESLTEIKNIVDGIIEQEQKVWFQKSYNLYDKEMCHESTEYILARRNKLPDDTLNMLETRCKAYTDWRFPGLVIRPGLENFARIMTPNDPLYLVDQHRDLLEPCINSFPETYQRRVRPYVIDERSNQEILIKLPNEQFGLCVVYNFFNFRPMELIKKWLAEIYQKLRPGGVLIMTINDCDRESGVILAENNFACYTPGRLVTALAEMQGFDILYSWNDYGPMTWLELKKPGELFSLRGGQTLAKIVPKTVAESK